MRIKCEHEMIEAFGEDWRDEAFPGVGWDPEMDNYLGEEILPLAAAGFVSSKEIVWNGFTWSIGMTVGDVPNIRSGASTPVKTASRARFKTHAEMLQEYGDGWREIVIWNDKFNDRQGDYLTDSELTYINENGRFICRDQSIITHDMVIGHSYTKAIPGESRRGDRFDSVDIKMPVVKAPLQDIPRNVRIMTKGEFIEKYGDAWREKVAFGWVTKMDEFFGKKLSDSEIRCLEREGMVILGGYKYSKSMCLGFDGAKPSVEWVQSAFRSLSAKTKSISEDPSGESIVVDVSPMTLKTPRLVY